MKETMIKQLVKNILFIVSALSVALNYFNIFSPLFECSQRKDILMIYGLISILICSFLFVKNHYNKYIFLDVIVIFLIPVSFLIFSFQAISGKIYDFILKINTLFQCYSFSFVSENVDMVMFVLGIIFMFLWFMVELPIYINNKIMKN